LDISDLIKMEQAAALGGVSIRTLQRQSADGRCPAPVRFGRDVFFKESEIRAWAAGYQRWERHAKKRSPMACGPKD
jgi:predicted DNA-binding transcriptional regulator AlpA